MHLIAVSSIINTKILAADLQQSAKVRTPSADRRKYGPYGRMLRPIRNRNMYNMANCTSLVASDSISCWKASFDAVHHSSMGRIMLVDMDDDTVDDIDADRFGGAGCWSGTSISNDCIPSENDDVDDDDIDDDDDDGEATTGALAVCPIGNDSTAAIEGSASAARCGGGGADSDTRSDC
jgi:hypothetical protein